MKTTSSTYMVQLSDGSIRNGLITTRECLFALKMNLLFFDELYASAPAILRNHFLYQLHRKPGDRDALRQIYKKNIRPVLIEQNRDILDVAESINTSDKFIGISESRLANRRDLIRDHAEFIASAYPDYYPVPGQISRTNYYYALLNAIEQYPVRQGSQNQQWKHFTRRLQRVKNKDSFRTADAYALADNTYSPTTRRLIRGLSFLAMEYLTAPVAADEFSLSSKASWLFDRFFRAHYGIDPAIMRMPPAADGFSSELRLQFPTDQVLRASLSQFLELREQDMFKLIRSLLVDYRAKRSNRILNDIEEIYNATIDDLVRFLSGRSAAERDRILKSMKERDNAIRVGRRNAYATSHALALGVALSTTANLEQLQFAATVATHLGIPEEVVRLVPLLTYLPTIWLRGAIRRTKVQTPESVNYPNMKKSEDTKKSLGYDPVDGQTG